MTTDKTKLARTLHQKAKVIAEKLKVRDASLDAILNSQVLSTEERRDIVNHRSLEKISPDIAWDAAWKALMPTDGTEPVTIHLITMLRSSYELPPNFRAKLAELLDPLGTEYEHKLVVQTNIARKDAISEVVTMIQVITHLESELQISMETNTKRPSKRPSLETAVQNVAKHLGTNRTAIYRYLKLFREIAPDEADGMKIISPQSK